MCVKLAANITIPDDLSKFSANNKKKSTDFVR